MQRPAGRRFMRRLSAELYSQASVRSSGKIAAGRECVGSSHRSSSPGDQTSRLRWSGVNKPNGAQMYAVIKTGGKQYKVAAGDRLKVEQLTAEVGQEVVLDQSWRSGKVPSCAPGRHCSQVPPSRPRCLRTACTRRCASSRCAAASTTNGTAGIVRPIPSSKSAR